MGTYDLGIFSRSIRFYRGRGSICFRVDSLLLEELSGYLLIWTACVGSSLAIKSGSFPNVELFMDWFGPNLKKKIENVAKIIETAFLLFLLSVGIIMSIKQRNQMAATLPISMMWPYLALPFGISLILPYSFLNLFYLPQKGN